MQPQAEGVINDVVGTAASGQEIIDRLYREQAELEAAERAKVGQYIQGVRSEITGMTVAKLGADIGGLYDGSNIYMGTGTLLVDQSIEHTLARAGEVSDHERYHREHDHTASMRIVEDTRENFVAIIGGLGFTQEELLEGLTVTKTGDRFVAQEYVGFERKLKQGAGNAGLSLAEVERAVDSKDLTLIDDRRRQTPLAA